MELVSAVYGVLYMHFGKTIKEDDSLLNTTFDFGGFESDFESLKCVFIQCCTEVLLKLLIVLLISPSQCDKTDHLHILGS